MFTRTLWLGCVAAMILGFASTRVIADEEPNDNADWLTWTVKDCKDGNLDLSDHQNKTVYVFVFTPGNSDSCAWVKAAASYIHDHSNKADQVLGFCSDASGGNAIKLYIRQEEWKRRTDEWNAAQESAKQAAVQANQSYETPAAPDYTQQIKDEMNNAEDLGVLIERHLPFKTCQRCEAMWTWLTKRMAGLPGSPRLLKINASGHLVHEWTELPNPFSVD